jgi:DNA-binding LacI/PurR family transcriptional regulator
MPSRYRRVPEAISVIGFGNIESSNYCIPRLTTIHQPIAEIGEQAALDLHRRISGGINTGPEIIIPHKLIIRESAYSIARKGINGIKPSKPPGVSH